MIENSKLSSLVCAKYLDLPLHGANIPLLTLKSLHEDCKNAIKFVNIFKEDYLIVLNSNPDNFVIAHADYEGKLMIPHVISNNPRLDFCLIANHFFPIAFPPRIEKSAFIGNNVKIGDNVYIGHNCIIEDNVIIGSDSVIFHNVVISSGCTLGSKCVVKSGSVIGQKGFGFEYDSQGIPVTFPHYGKVIIGSHVEIGALNTIVAGGLTDTIIEDHVKTDDHVHIAHNCVVGHSSLITACVEISGSVKIGKKVWIGPNSSIIDKIIVGDNSTIGLGTVVTKSFEENSIVVGVPARLLRKK